MGMFLIQPFGALVLSYDIRLEGGKGQRTIM